MRDAFGGVFTMNLLLVFIFIYVAVTAVSLNYAKAFRIKNSIIDYIEQNEIIDPSTIGSDPKFEAILTDANYNKTCDSLSLNEGANRTGLFIDEYCFKGITIKVPTKTKIEGTTNSEIYMYEIRTYADWDLGAFNKLLALAGSSDNANGLKGIWSVKGEAKVVVKR